MTSKKKNEVSSERRTLLRQGADLEVRFSIVSGENGRKSRKIPGAIKNLSEEGFCLTTDLTMVDDLHVLTGRSGTSENALEITILFPGEEEVLVLGAACWYNLSKPDDSHRYHVGVRLENLSEDYRLLLRKFLHHRRKARFPGSLFNMKWFGRLRKALR